MLSGVTFGQFIPMHSLLHRLDPRAKVVGVVAAAMIVLVAADWRGFALAACVTLAALALSGLSPRIFLAGLRSLRVLLAVTFFIQLFLTPGEVLLGLGPLKITVEGLEAGVQIFLRLALLILITSLLTLTTSPLSLTAGLESMLSPLRRLGVPSHELAMIMTIAMSFVPTLLREAEILIKAQRSRGAGFSSGGPAGWARSMLPLLVPLFAGGLRRAEELATAMEARCYRGGANRTRMSSLKLSGTDYAAVAVTLLLLAGAIILKFL